MRFIPGKTQLSGLACGLVVAGCFAPLAQPAVIGGDQPTTFLFVQRTKAHVKYSKSEVLLSVVNDVSGYLGANRVALARDEFGGRTHAEAEMPLSTVLSIARDSGASLSAVPDCGPARNEMDQDHRAFL